MCVREAPRDKFRECCDESFSVHEQQSMTEVVVESRRSKSRPMPPPVIASSTNAVLHDAITACSSSPLVASDGCTHRPARGRDPPPRSTVNDRHPSRNPASATERLTALPRLRPTHNGLRCALTNTAHAHTMPRHGCAGSTLGFLLLLGTIAGMAAADGAYMDQVRFCFLV